MTIPIERYNALKKTEKLLHDMLTSKWVPPSMREEAKHCLRHYPYDVHLEELAKACPDILQTKD